MSGSIEKLVRVATPSLAPGPVMLSVRPGSGDSRLVTDWLTLLEARNGFYCFESALHVFPSRTNGRHLGLDEWNSPELWRKEYAGLDRGVFFVAEDIFGCQFGLVEDYICTFDPETGQFEQLCRSVAEWSELILDDFNLHTGYPLAHEWQSRFGALATGKRLAPKTPFVLGGEFAIENLFACEAVAGMKARGNLARQLVNVPDGTAIEYSIVD